MVQIKCIEKLKFERSHKDGRDIGWDNAFRVWISEGYADRFALVYREGMRMLEVYNKVLGSGTKKLSDDADSPIA